MTIIAACPHCSVQFSFDDSQSGTVASCPTCQGQITLAVPVAPPPAPLAIPPPLPTPRQQARVQRPSGAANIVGNTVAIDGTVYQLGTINSVRIAGGASGCFSVGFFLLFFVMAAGVFAGPGTNPDSYVLGVFSGVLALGLLVHIIQTNRTNTLMLTTSSGEVAALKSTNRQLLDAVAQDIVDAISSR